MKYKPKREGRAANMKAVGIIAEYNPFHSGHAYHIAEAKKLHGGYVIIVLSGDFVQRGEIAVYDKLLRTRHALENGADMVLQLPCVYSLGSAQRFAAGGVRILAGSGIADAICFGSECGDLDKLQSSCMSTDMENESYASALRLQLRCGSSFPSAAAKAAGEHFLSGANDMLATEYLRAIKKEAPELSAICIRREGAQHDEAEPSARFASAGFIREKLLSGKIDDACAFVPHGVVEALRHVPPRRQERLSEIILYALRRMSLDELASLPDVSEGLENVIYKQCRACTRYSEFLFASKSKRYTMARLRRISMCALLSIKKSDLELSPYIRVLGVRKESKQLLSMLCSKSALPVVTRYSDAYKLSPEAARMHEIDMLSSDIACFAADSPSVFDYNDPLIVV